MRNEIQIGNRLVGPGQAPFIIAEMSGNHNQSLERALQIVDAAAASGAHAIKLQTYTADTMTLNLSHGEFFIDDEKSLWRGNSLYDLYKVAHTPWDWHRPIFDRAKQHGMLCFSTPFDESALDLLEDLGAPCYKIASFENTYIPLIKKVARLKKPIIISTGMASLGELAETVEAVKAEGNDQLILLKCTSTYPSTPENTNLLTIPHMRELFDVQVGLSDHTMGCGASVAAVALGATVVEKHFTLDRKDGGVDSAFSLEPAELKMLVEESQRAWLAMGHVKYGSLAAEKNSLKFRRSIYVSKDIRNGERITPENIRCIRPGLGLPTKYYEEVLGKFATVDLKAGTPLHMSNLRSE
jgi:pseudaminic acid synthase